MTVGQELFGVVSGIADYGVFVRFPNGESGLVYTSEVCWIGEDVTYNMGDKIKVMVLGFKAGRGLSLSIKRATIPDAFDAFMKATPVESVITGRIKSIQDYGVFVTVSPGVQGLLHVSDIADISIFSKASIGNPLDVVVVAVEVERMRVRLRAAP
jgi:small subunit ribosomal protein S1